MDIDDFEDFAEDMNNIASKRSGIGKAKRDALKETGDEFLTRMKRRIVRRGTDKGGTLYSKTSPYTGGENESTNSNMHMRHKSSWNIERIGNDFAVVYPKPEIHKRAAWMEYGTETHFPSGSVPMYFFVNGKKIVVTNDNPSSDGGNTEQPGSVSGVEGQRFWRDTVQEFESGTVMKDIFEDNIVAKFNEYGYMEGQ